MLLVKSRESKSSGSLKLKSVVKSINYAYLFTFLCGVASPAAYAQSSESFGSAGSVASIFLSLLLVVAIIFGLAYIMRRFNVANTGNGDLKVVASLVAGTKERIMVVEVGDEQYLLGITAHNINHLATLPTPISPERNDVAEQFKQKLASAMAGKLPAAKSEVSK